MKRALKIIALILFAALVVIQFIRPDFTNPPIEAAKTLEATTQVPEDVKAILIRSCTDCHSNQTVYPWYSNVQPTAWLLADHIKEGRRELNFSEWGNYNDKRKKHKLEEICEQVETKEMPLPSYLWIHRGARVSDDEIKKICDWTKSESAKLPIAEPQNEPNK